MKRHHIWTFILSIFFIASTAVAAPDGFIYEGVLEDSNGVITTSATLILRIYDSNESCLLYEETQTVTPGTDGSFSIRVGSATSDVKRTANDPQLAMSSVFLSSGIIRPTGSTNCTMGYNAASSDSRHLVINVNGTDLTPAVEISSAPFAIAAGTADKIGTYDSSKLLRSDGTATVTALTDAKVTLLMNLLSGALTTPTSSGDVVNKGYVDTLTSGYLPTSTVFSGDVSGTSSSLSVDKIKGATVDTTGLVANKVLKYDGTKWVPGDDNTGSAMTLTSGKVWIGNGSNGPSEVSLSGDATVAATGLVTLKSVGTSGTYVKVATDAQGRVTSGSGLLSSDVTGALGFSPMSAATGFVNGGNSFGTATSIGTNDSQALSFKTNSTTQMTITTTGNVGIGTTTPSNPLDIVGSVNGMLASTITNSNSGGTSWYRVTNDASHSLQFGVAGTSFSSSGVYAPNTATIYSDLNLAGLNLGTEGSQPVGFFTNNALRMTLDASGKLGVGTASPSANLTVGDGVSTDGMFMALGYGTVGSSGASLPVSGAGTRMMWYPKKAAFRAGYVSGTQWDDSNIGNYSFSAGLNSQATATNSVAIGNGNMASASSAVALGGTTTAAAAYAFTTGFATTAAGTYSTAMGNSSAAAASYSFAVGNTTTALGTSSAALGSNTTANAMAQTTIGQYNSPVGTETATTWVTTDPLFVIGNGTSSAAKSNAMMVLKNGNVAFGTSAPTSGAKLDIVGTGTNASSIILPRDTTANRPTGVNGMIRYATDTNKFEAYENGAWTNIIGSGGGSGTVTSVAAGSGLTGGTITTSGTLAVDSTTTGSPGKIVGLDAAGATQVQALGLTDGANAVTLAATASMPASYTLRMPTALPGSSGQMLQSDSSGNLSWVSASGITNAGLGAGTTLTPFLKWNGGTWAVSRISVDDLVGANSTTQIPKTCTQAQTLVWSTPTDTFICADIKQKDAATVSLANMSIYVSASGSDTTCNGTAAATSSSAPNCAFATLQKAVDSVPDIVRHQIKILLMSDFSVQTAGTPLAVINKSIAAQSLTSGPLLEITSNDGTMYSLNGVNYANTAGIVIGSSARGVYIHGLKFVNFTDNAVRVDGGLSEIDSTDFSGNLKALSVVGGGRLMLGGTVNIDLPNSAGTDTPRGIEVWQGSFSSDAALNITLNSAQNAQGISVSYGDAEIQDDSTISMNSSVYQTGVQIETGGSLSIDAGKSLLLYGSNYINSGPMVDVRGGHLSVNGTLMFQNVGSTALNCQSSASCDFYGLLRVDSGAGYSSYVNVQSGSVLNSQGNLQINAPVYATGGAAIMISDSSTMRLNPNGAGYSFGITNGSGGASAIRVMNNSQFELNTNNPYNFNFSGYNYLADVSNMSSFIVNATTLSGAYGYQLRNDETSKITVPTGMSFAVPIRNCSGSMISYGAGSAGFCIDSSTTTQMNYYDALNACSNRGMKLCSKRQYALACANGLTVSGLHWTENMEDVTCSPSSISATTDSSSSPNYYFRCCY